MVQNKIKTAAVLWFTGLSGSGKTTIASEIFQELQKRGLRVEHLDGDSIREIFPNTGFSKEEREIHIKRAGFLASKLEKHDVFVIASLISPYRETRDFVRIMCKKFIEIYISTPLEVCEKRDIKGLYKKARKGEIKKFTGIDDPYEPPLKPEIAIDTSNENPKDSAGKIIKFLEKKKLICQK